MALGTAEPAGISAILQDVEFFETTFGSTTAARNTVEAQARELAELRRRVNDLQVRAAAAEEEAATLRERYRPVELFDHLAREFVCLGALNLLQQSLVRWHEGRPPQLPQLPRTVFLAIHETSVPETLQPAPATPPTRRAARGTPIRTPVTEALSARNSTLRVADVTVNYPRPSSVGRGQVARGEPSSQPLVSSKTTRETLTRPSTKAEEAQAEDKGDGSERTGEKRKRRRRRQRALAASVIVSPSDDDDDDDNDVVIIDPPEPPPVDNDDDDDEDDVVIIDPPPAPAPSASPSRPEKRARVSVSPPLGALEESSAPLIEVPQASTEQAAAPEVPSPQTPTAETPLKARSANATRAMECPAASPDIVRPAYKRSTHTQGSSSPLSPTSSPSPIQEQRSIRHDTDDASFKADARPQASPTASPTLSTEPVAPSSALSSSTDDALLSSQASRRTRAAAKQDEPAGRAGVGVKRSTKDVLVKQIVEWPSDRRNLVNMKQSAMFLTLKGIQALEKKEPWNDMFLRRARYSSLVNPETLTDRGLKWLKATLRVQFVLRREFWERLHWLPISETVCVGVEWSKYRKSRTRRALYAARVWRKLYEESIELMADGVLRDDVWCDPALWYMPASHVSWLPKSGDLQAELATEDYENPSRTYFAMAPSWHPFYQDERFTAFIEQRHPLPTFSPHQEAKQQQPTDAEGGGEEAVEGEANDAAS